MQIMICIRHVSVKSIKAQLVPYEHRLPGCYTLIQRVRETQNQMRRSLWDDARTLVHMGRYKLSRGRKRGEPLR